MTGEDQQIEVPDDSFAETVVTGVALLNPRVVALILRIVTASQFYLPAHGRLLEAATTLADEWARRTPDERVAAWMSNEELAQRAAELTGRPDDAAVALQAMATTPVLSGVAPFCHRVVEAWEARRVMIAAAELYNALGSGKSLAEVRPLIAATWAS